MNRLHVLQAFQPQIGGVPGYVRQLTDGLLDRGWQITVAGPAQAIDSWDLDARGADARPLRLARRPQPLRDTREIARLAEYIRRTKVDLVHTHSSKAGLVAGLAARRAGVPVVHTPHSWAFDIQSPRPVPDAFAAIERALTRRCRSAIIAVSDYERRIALDRRVSEDVITTVVHTGLPPAGPALSRSEARAQLDLGADDTVVAWVGRRAMQKRPQDLCVLGELLGPRATVVALGHGLSGTPEGLEVLISGGRILDENVRATVLYAAADVFVQTSGWEGFSLAVIEAMRASLPVVAYAAGGTVEQVAHGETGFLTAVGDVPSVAAHVLDLAGKPGRRLAMGRAGAERVAQRYGYARMLDGVETAYSDVLGRASVPSRREVPVTAPAAALVQRSFG